MKLPESYYLHHHVVEIAEDLIGKVLTTNINGHTTSGIITETEAYNGIYDKACHAYNGKRTARNDAMYGSGGISYVYLCYGIHHLFNIVTNQQDIPDAVLIRGIFPLNGLDKILERRNTATLKKDLTTGPGKVTQSLGIEKEHDKIKLTEDLIYIENQNIHIPSNLIQTGKRIGIDYAGEDALLPYRFYVKGEDVLEKVI
jgi:DNA-3-methyladenine glycosylase